jgi:hypothetical protein
VHRDRVGCSTGGRTGPDREVVLAFKLVAEHDVALAGEALVAGVADAVAVEVELLRVALLRAVVVATLDLVPATRALLVGAAAVVGHAVAVAVERACVRCLGGVFLVGRISNGHVLARLGSVFVGSVLARVCHILSCVLSHVVFTGTRISRPEVRRSRVRRSWIHGNVLAALILLPGVRGQVFSALVHCLRVDSRVLLAFISQPGVQRRSVAQDVPVPRVSAARIFNPRVELPRSVRGDSRHISSCLALDEARGRKCRPRARRTPARTPGGDDPCD